MAIETKATSPLVMMARVKAYLAFTRKKSHRIIEMDRCLVHHEKADAIAVTIKDMLKSFKLQPYDEDSQRGFLRHILIRRGHVSGEIMVVLVVSGPVFPSKKNFVKALKKAHPEITTILMNVNNRRTSMVLGDKESVLYGKGLSRTPFVVSISKYQPSPFIKLILFRQKTL